MTPQDARASVVDHVARAMTAGAPGADFTDRVMAPIYGRPRRDFVARVMAGIDTAPAPAPQRVSAHIYRPAFAAAALALAALAILWRPADVTWPATNAPVARNIAEIGAPRVSVVTASPVSPQAGTRSSARPSGPGAQAAETIAAASSPAPSMIYTIDALAGPTAIEFQPIEPEAVTVPALAAPPAIVIPRLRTQKEKP